MAENWYIVRCLSGQEGRAERFLEKLGYPHGWHPTERVRAPSRGFQMALAAWRRMGGNKASKPDRYTTKPVVTGYVLVPADNIDPARVKHSPFNCWMEVVCVGDRPYAIPSAQMAAMRKLPSRLVETIEEAARLAEEDRKARLPVVGAEVEAIAGPFTGHKGYVAQIEGNSAEVEMGVIIGSVWFGVDDLERVAP